MKYKAAMPSKLEHLNSIHAILIESANHIDKHGHHQFDMWEDKACCIMGAPRMVKNEAAYSHIVRTLLAHIGYDEAWNDQPGRTKEEVVGALFESTNAIDEQVLESVYGSEWKSILDLIVEVDSWSQADFDKIQRDNQKQIFAPGQVVDSNYISCLAGFLMTVMTSGKVDNSIPFKNYFDKKYNEINMGLQSW